MLSFIYSDDVVAHREGNCASLVPWYLITLEADGVLGVDRSSTLMRRPCIRNNYAQSTRLSESCRVGRTGVERLCVREF